MNSEAKIPDPQTRARSVANLREVCRQLDSVTMKLDEVIARLEADIRNSPLTTYRLGKAKQPDKSINQA